MPVLGQRVSGYEMNGEVDKFDGEESRSAMLETIRVLIAMNEGWP